ncbi:GTPase Era [Ancylobacter vacuolatus]|uniref:GTPase Era n=1 Tax=Ancylobacter vacuolatus TaxID=223389 RepID=A0ABU0DC10_9HYPH|nr:GTPase Era [Ancylobacter vacuolatus]MDQ0345883.1 GTP-binding protein Era [Ancylobacter vacuolatus]
MNDIIDETPEEGREEGSLAAPEAARENTRCGFVALIGTPNAGKSTLTNTLVGTKVSIVSHKVQTTRSLVRGIAIEGATQIVLVDTPGIFAPKRRLEKAMVRSAWNGAGDADAVVLLIDARAGLNEEVESIIRGLADVRRPRAILLNKIDLVKRESLLELAAKVAELTSFDRLFMVSALAGHGLKELRAWLAQILPFGPWLYPEDQISDAPMRSLAAEITREKLFHRLHEELPYRSTVETDSWQERKDGSVRIEQTIFVERESQRKIVLGKGGDTIKAISMAARKELTEIVEAPVHLFLFVKVRENWADDPARYREMGLDFPQE